MKNYKGMKPEDICSYTGKILWIDVDTQETKILSTYDYLEGVGGMFMSAYLQWKFGKPGVTDGRDPESLLMFLTGPLTGTPIPGSARFTVSYQQALQKPSLWAQSSVAGGGFGPEMKFAGWDGIILRGKAEKPVFIFVEDNKVEFHSAEKFFYADTYSARNQIVEQLGGDTRIRTGVIGPAGANLNAMSTIQFDTSHAAAQHPGAIMGAKNVKGIAVRGHDSIKIADPKTVREIRDKLYYMSEDVSWRATKGRRNRILGANKHFFPGEVIRSENCYGCFSCRMPYVDSPLFPKGGNNCGFSVTEYATAQGLQRRLLEYKETPYGDAYTEPMRYTIISLTGKNNMEMGKLFDYYGISGYELLGMRTPMNLVNMMVASDKVTPAFKNWLETEVGAEFGTMEFGRKYIHKVANREGLVGEWMADGVERAAMMLRDQPELFGITKEDGEFAWIAYQHAYPIHGSFEHHFNRPTFADPRDNPKTIRISPISSGIYSLGSRQMGKSSHCATELYDESQRNSRAMAYNVYGDERAACRYLDENDEPVIFMQPYLPDDHNFYTLDGRLSKPVKPNYTKGTPLAILQGAAFSFYNDALGTCDWLWPVLYGNTTSVLFPGAQPKDLVNVNFFENVETASHPEWSAMCVEATTGIPTSLEDFYYNAFKAMTVERCVQLRDSGRTRENDMFNNVTAFRVDSCGVMLGYDNMGEWKKGMAMVYEMLGWDPETGVPTRMGLHHYGLDAIADDLAARGLLSEKEINLNLRAELLAEGKAETEKNAEYYARVWREYVEARDAADAASETPIDYSNGLLVRNSIDAATQAANRD